MIFLNIYTTLKNILFICLFIWLHRVLVARVLSSCARAEEHMGSVVVAPELSCPAGGGIFVPWPRIKPVSPALEGGFLTSGPPGKYPYQFLSHLLFVQTKSYKSQCKTDYKKKKKIRWTKLLLLNGGRVGRVETLTPLQPLWELRKQFRTRVCQWPPPPQPPLPRRLLTPLQAKGPRDIAKFTHLDGGPLGRSEFLASVPRFSLPHSNTLLNWNLLFFRRKHTGIQRFLKLVVFFCFNPTNSGWLGSAIVPDVFKLRSGWWPPGGAGPPGDRGLAVCCT